MLPRLSHSGNGVGYKYESVFDMVTPKYGTLDQTGYAPDYGDTIFINFIDSLNSFVFQICFSEGINAHDDHYYL